MPEYDYYEQEYIRSEFRSLHSDLDDVRQIQREFGKDGGNRFQEVYEEFNRLREEIRQLRIASNCVEIRVGGKE